MDFYGGLEENLDWELDGNNPAVSLEKYYRATRKCKEFTAKNAELERENETLQENVEELKDRNTALKQQIDDLKADLSSRKNERLTKQEEQNRLKEKNNTMDTGDEEEEAESDRLEAEKAMQYRLGEAEKEFAAKKEKLGLQREAGLSKNEAWLRERLMQITGRENADFDRVLTETEQKALAFEEKRRQLELESDQKISEWKNDIAQEELHYQELTGSLKREQDEISAQYEPDISRYKNAISSINRKYQPDLQKYRNEVNQKKNEREKELKNLQDESNREKQQASREIESCQKEFKQTKKQYDAQIKGAKANNQLTAQMENSKMSRLNAINDNIKKINSRLDKNIARIGQRIGEVNGKYAKLIEKAESRLNEVKRSCEKELAEPTRAYEKSMGERDGQIADIQAKIDEAERQYTSGTEKKKFDIEAEQGAKQRNVEALDRQIIAYAANGKISSDDIAEEVNTPFAALHSRTDKWIKMASDIAEDKFSAVYPKEHEKQKKYLAAQEYPKLEEILKKASLHRDKMSLYASNRRSLIFLGIAVCIFGAVLSVVLCFLLKISAGIIGFFAMAAGIAIAVWTVIQSNREFSLLCRYVSLAVNYREFPAVKQQSARLTENRALEEMRSLGKKLYDLYHGKEEAEAVHRANKNSIEENYQNGLKLLEAQLEKEKRQIRREKDSAIEKINAEAAEQEEQFNKARESLEDQIASLSGVMEDLDGTIESINANIEDRDRKIEENEGKIETVREKIRENEGRIRENSRFVEAVRAPEKQLKLQNRLNDAAWCMPMAVTKGILNDYLYIIPEKERGEIYKICQNKKALVVNYDLDCLSEREREKGASVNKVVQELLTDLMYAVYRVNTKDTYAQYVVDTMMCTDEFKSTRNRNIFSIRRIEYSLDGLKDSLREFELRTEQFKEKNVTVDQLNKSNYERRDRPEVYNILYIIYGPNERRGKLDDTIKRLMGNGDKYGFIPVFICDRSTWENGIQEKESLYKDIKSRLDNPVVVYRRTSYQIV